MSAPNKIKGLGRSATRSRRGCTVCKARRVRCDERRPTCGHCERLQQECVFAPIVPRRSRPSISATSAAVRRPTGSRTVTSNEGSPQISNVAAASSGISSDGQISADTGQMDDTPSSATSGLDSGSQGQQYLSPSQSEHIFLPGNLGSNVSKDYQLQKTNNDHELNVTADMSCRSSSSHIGIEAVSENSAYSPYFGSFFNFPDIGSSFATFSFSDLQPINDCNPMENFGNRNIFTHGDLQQQSFSQHNEDIQTSPESLSSHNGNTFMPPYHTTFGTDQSISTDAFMSKENTRAFLLSYFKRSVQPPASLVSVDSLGWYQMQRYLIRAASIHNIAMNALLALAQALSVRDSASRSSSSAQWGLAFELQQKCCKELKAELDKGNVNEKVQNALLASVFLLAWFEVIFDEQDAHRFTFPTLLAETIIMGDKKWNSGSRRLLQWLNSIDAKASHLGGRHLLTPKSLEIVLQYRFEVGYVAGGNADSDDDTGSAGTDDESAEVGLAEQSVAKSRKKNVSSSKFWRARPPLTPRVIKMNVFNALLQPALEFHLVSQSFSRRIGSHDRHHRTRNTVEDEFEVISACQGFEMELKKLWRHRPRVLDLTAKDLSEIVCQDVAKRLEELFSVYAAGFWAHFLYMHRVAWWSLPHSNTAKEAVVEQWRMMRRSIGEPEEIDESNILSCSLENRKPMHPGLMWPLFMFGCETPSTFQQQWAVAQLLSIGENNGGPDTENQDNDALPPYRLERKGAQNAMRASVLLDELIQRQNKTKSRVDGKYLSQELFGCHFSII